MVIVEWVARLIVPAIIFICALLMIKSKKIGAAAFSRGATTGLHCAIGLIPTMVMLCVGLSMFCASGIIDIIAELLSPITSKIGVPADILPLIVTRPISGSASTAAYARLLEDCGADSAAAILAGIIMGSSDTLIYVITVYFSGAENIRGTRHAFPVAAIVMLFCIFLSVVLYKIFF